MKWLGCVLFVGALLFCFGLYQMGQDKIAGERKQVSERIAKERENAENILSGAENSLKALEDKLHEEEAKVKQLEMRKLELDNRKTGTETRINQLEQSIDRLEDTKDQVKDERRANMAQISELQKKIESAEKGIALLKEKMETVSDKVGL